MCFLSVYNGWALLVKSAFVLAGTKMIDDLSGYLDEYPSCIMVMNNITNPITPSVK